MAKMYRGAKALKKKMDAKYGLRRKRRREKGYINGHWRDFKYPGSKE